MIPYQATKTYHPIYGKKTDVTELIFGVSNAERAICSAQKVLWLTTTHKRRGKENSIFQHCEVSFTAQEISFTNMTAQG